MRGGPGNDLVYGGTSSSLDGGSRNFVDTKYLYGDEGNDSIWGSTNLDFQYIFGGSGLLCAMASIGCCGSPNPFAFHY